MMNSFQFTDWAFDFSNRDYQDLVVIESKDPNRKAFVLNIITRKAFHSDYSNVDILIECVLEE